MFKSNVSLNRWVFLFLWWFATGAIDLKWLAESTLRISDMLLVLWKHVTFFCGSLQRIQRYLPRLWFANHPSCFPRFTTFPSFFASHLNVPCFHWWTSVSVASAGCGQGKPVGRLPDVLDRRRSWRTACQDPHMGKKRKGFGTSYLLPRFFVAQTGRKTDDLFRIAFVGGGWDWKWYLRMSAVQISCESGALRRKQITYRKSVENISWCVPLLSHHM